LGSVAGVSSSSEPLLSIVIVAYKSRDEIGACLASLPRTLPLTSKTKGDVEVILIDNSPGDGTGEFVQEHYPWVTYIATETNLGFGRANNLGFAPSYGRSEFVLFLNPDTVCNEEAIVRCLDRLRDDEKIGLISPRLMLPNGSMDLACRRSIPTLWDGFCRASGLARRFPHRALFSGYNLTHLPPDRSYDVGAINGAFMMGRRAVFEQVAEKSTVSEVQGISLSAHGFKLRVDRLAPSAAVFDERFFMYGDDLDLCIRMTRAGWRVVYDGSVSIVHVKGVSVAKDYALMSQAIFDANRDVYLKHFGRSAFARLKYRIAFSVWKKVALLRARRRGHRRVRPL
jgi:GT2 family glycosyltransferase